jgi:hypothetical protein
MLKVKIIKAMQDHAGHQNQKKMQDQAIIKNHQYYARPAKD